MHEGHRDRLYTKIIRDDPSVTEVELVEFYLCLSIPRKDVKPIARELLSRYGSIGGIAKAPVESLIETEGLGKKAAASFKILEKMMKYGESRQRETASNTMNTFEYFRGQFDGVEVEQLVVALLGPLGEVVKKLVYTDFERTFTSVNVNEITAEVAKAAPTAVVMAHNHFSGNIYPSAADDQATKRLFIALNVHGVKLYDHLIFCGDEYFSYFVSGRLEKIKESVKNSIFR